MEIEYITEEPEIYDPNFIFFKRIFEAFKVTLGLFLYHLNAAFVCLFCYKTPFFSLSQLTDDVKKEKEKEPEKAEKQETAVLRKKGFEDEKKDSDDSDEVCSLHLQNLLDCYIEGDDFFSLLL